MHLSGGLDVEVISREALMRAHAEATLPSEREHVTPYICGHPELFSLLNVKHSPDLSAYRLTVDEPADLEVVRQIYKHFQDHNFTLMEMIRFLMENREVWQLNQKFERNEGYRRALQNELHGTDVVTDQ
jgi:spore coat polysaccharide biosynthesis protein SpsF